MYAECLGEQEKTFIGKLYDFLENMKNLNR